jgi:DNA-binding beta-propeller fold protein YncE
VEVGAAPWGLTRHQDRAFVATAEGVAVLDLPARSRTTLIPYETPPADIGYGEYRAGGMGIAASPDGDLVFAGNYFANGPSRLEVIDWREERVVGSVEIGVRPFDVLANRDGREAFSIDHDSYTVTVLDVEKMSARILPVSPLGDALGLAGFEKPHYAVLDPDGKLLLPFQGQVLARLDPATGAYEAIPLEANTHQHGVAINRAGNRLLIVGTGPAGGATGPASLTDMNLRTGEQQLIPLARPHERVAFSPDERLAYLTGGYSFAGGGWNGITIVDLSNFSTREVAVGARPLDIVVLDDNSG